MTPLAALIGEEIAACGPMRLDRFMALALGHPEHGYYRTRDPLGRHGDFITAPEISQIFGELIGLWLVTSWDALDRPDPFYLVELGPGRGTLMADALRAAALRPAFGAAARLVLVETSPALRAAQAERLKGLAPSSSAPLWLDSLDALPPGPLLLVANEFFDALPIRQFRRTVDGWAERLVEGSPRSGFAMTEGPSRPAERQGPALALLATRSGAGAITPGTCVETCDEALLQAREIGRRIARHGGAGLVIDYGYLHHDPGQGRFATFGTTLQGVRNHGFVDPLADPGESDLTAHVDFTALIEALHGEGAATAGPVDQGRFLETLGGAIRLQRLAEAQPESLRKALETGYRRLIAPSEMGTLFKVLGFTSKPGLNLAGLGEARRG